MPKECAAGDCHELQVSGSNFSFHKFPSDKDLRLEWAVKVNREVRCPKTGKKRLWMPSDHDVLCSRHFAPDQFTMRTRLALEDKAFKKFNFLPMLTEDAVPIIFDHNVTKRKREEAATSRRSAVLKKKQKKEEMESFLQTSREESEEAVEPRTSPIPQCSAADDTSTAITVTVDPGTTFKRDTAVQAQPILVNTKQQTVHKTIGCTEVQTEESTIEARHVHSELITVAVFRENWAQTEAQPSIHSKDTQTDLISTPELEEDEEGNRDAEEEGTDPKTDDPDWQCNFQPPRRCQLTEDLNTADPFKERKYIVFESQLHTLLSKCRRCSQPCQVIKKGECGTSVEFSCECNHDTCGHKFTWRTQPYSQKLPLGNLVMAAAAFFTACSPSRLINALKQADIACFSLQTYNSIQTSYLVPAVRNMWQRCQQRLFKARRGKSVKLAGDGRCDSPGHCAKYGSYTLMDAETAEVLHSELIQSNQVRNSHAMEIDGLKKGLTTVKKEVQISHLITDRHASVKKYMRENEPDIIHHFDIWHMAKGVGKKVEAAGKKRQNVHLSLWSQSISNHMYWSSASTPEGPGRTNTVKEKWLSIRNHVADIHEGHGTFFPRCEHDDLEPRAWIKKGTPQHRTLDNIVSSKYLLRDIGLLSPDVQTASLESYHATVCHFAPKLNSFTFPVMQAKLYLAAMHFNANVDRKQAVTSDGDLQWTVAYPKSSKGMPVAKPVKVPQSRNYIQELYGEVILLRLENPSYRKARDAQQDYFDSVPEPLSKSKGPVNKADVVANHCARLNWNRSVTKQN